MIKLLQGLGWVAGLVLVFGMLAAPERTADTLVSLAGGLAWTADHVGAGLAAIAEHLPKN